MSRPVTVEDVLRARDERVACQQQLLRRGVPIISFTMNIAGPIKTSPLIRRAFLEGCGLIRRELRRMEAPILEERETDAFTGYEALFAVETDAQALKSRMCLIEDSCALGRLFDMDVIAPDGQHLSRQSERPCLICGGPVRVCARSRAHSAQELFARAQEIMESHFGEAFIRRTGEKAQKALLYEALTTPKPGLVDCRNTGAHRDMDLFSFAASASALRPYFEQCVRIGLAGGDPRQLQYAGLLAEDAMLRAAHANTHKGAIFSLGILCCALGQCGEGAELSALADKAAALGEHYLGEMRLSPSARTGGEKQYRTLGLTGARGEAASGFASVREIALPALEEALRQGKPLEEAGVHALLYLMARVKDSNVLRRGGEESQQWMEASCARLLQAGYTREDVIALDEAFIRRNISPGGCADLLAAAYFLHFLTDKDC